MKLDPFLIVCTKKKKKTKKQKTKTNKKTTQGASFVVKQVRTLLMIPATHIRVQVQVLATLLQIQIPANVPEKEALDP